MMYRVQYLDKDGEWKTWVSAIKFDWALMYRDLMKYRFAEYEKRIIQDEV